MTRILFLGSHLRSFHCFRHLVNSVSDATVVAVIPHQTQPPIREDQDVRPLARERSIPVIEFSEISNVDYDLGISLMFDRILPPAVVDRPPRGFVNFHLGPLPRFRGANSVLHAIRLARKDAHWTFGVTLHYIDHTLDTGPVIDLIEVPIFEDDTAQALHLRASERIYELFVRNIDQLVKSSERLPARPQSGPSYSFKRSGVNHEVDLSADPDEIYDLVRALSFPGKSKPYAVIGGRKFYLSVSED
jgi:methionyl-tRNA formyltransferase